MKCNKIFDLTYNQHGMLLKLTVFHTNANNFRWVHSCLSIQAYAEYNNVSLVSGHANMQAFVIRVSYSLCRPILIISPPFSSHLFLHRSQLPICTPDGLSEMHIRSLLEMIVLQKFRGSNSQTNVSPTNDVEQLPNSGKLTKTSNRQAMNKIGVGESIGVIIFVV